MSKVDVLDRSGKPIEKIELKDEIFGVKPQADLLAQSVRVILANRRLGTAKTKGRGEVNKTTKKMYKQKHTGRARHGSASAPIFVGGGVAHGPFTGKKMFTSSKSMRQTAMKMALSESLKAGKLLILKDLPTQVSTHKLSLVFKDLKACDNTLLVSAGVDRNLVLSGRNLKFLKILPVASVSVYDLLNSQKIVLLQKTVEALNKNLAAQAEKLPKEGGN